MDRILATSVTVVIFVGYACKRQKLADLRIESSPCNHSINDSGEIQSKKLMTEIDAKIDCFYKIILHLHYQTLSNMLRSYENDSILNATFFGIYKDNRHI